MKITIRIEKAAGEYHESSRDCSSLYEAENATRLLWELANTELQGQVHVKDLDSNFVRTIRCYRNTLGVSLADAKKAVELAREKNGLFEPMAHSANQAFIKELTRDNMKATLLSADEVAAHEVHSS